MGGLVAFIRACDFYVLLACSVLMSVLVLLFFIYSVCIYKWQVPSAVNYSVSV